MDWGLLFLIVFSIALGFALGRRTAPSDDEPQASLLEPHYIRGLNYFLNDQEDAAIDTFIHALDVNSETLETHLALGNLLRKRGEVGRAIKVHQNLLARPGLPVERSQQVQLELAKDFVRSGLMDRAEVLLQELVSGASVAIKSQCLKFLIEIYRDEKEWLKGIHAINQLSNKRFTKLPEEWRLVESQFYCELAEEALARGDYLVCRRQIKAAMAADKNSVRASLILAALEQMLGHYKDAIKSLKQIPFQDPAFLPEMIPRLVECYRLSGNQKGLNKSLRQLLDSHSHSSVVIELAELLAREKGDAAAIEFIAENVSRTPSVGMAERMLSMQLQGHGSELAVLELTQKAIISLQSARPLYRCNSCGFGGRQLHWLCPSCKSWGTVKPAD